MELYQQMAEVMTRNVTVVRYNDKLAETLQVLETFAQDYERIGVDDKSRGTTPPPCSCASSNP